MDALAARSQAAYRALVWDDPAFPRFFRSFTPIDELALLEIGSRPATPARGGRPASSRRCARSRGCSPGRRTAACCRPGTARHAPLARPTATVCARCAGSTATGRSSARCVENLEMTLAKSSLRDRARATSRSCPTRPSRSAVRRDRRGARADGRGGARRSSRPTSCSTGTRRAALDPAAQPVRRSDERDPGRAARAPAAAATRQRAAARCCARSPGSRRRCATPAECRSGSALDLLRLGLPSSAFSFASSSSTWSTCESCASSRSSASGRRR